MASKLEIIVDNQSLDITDDVEVSISYNLEDESDFQQKKSSEALSINLPATLNNEQISGSFGNISILNIPEGSKQALIKAGGITLLAGKAFIRKAYHQDKLLSYDYDFYGNNANWIIDMQTLTLYDVLRDLQFTFSLKNIGDTWIYDGRPSTYPPGDDNYRPLKHILVFAPVRDGLPWDDYTDTATSTQYKDSVFVADRATPSLSVFYLIQKAFTDAGYRLQSDFFNTDYFRRLVMPWTWGSFSLSEGTRLDALAIEVENSDYVVIQNSYQYVGFVDVNPDKIDKDESNCYSYDATSRQMRWTYDPTQDFGLIQANFEMQLEYDMNGGSGYQSLWVRWYKNGVQVKEEQRFKNKVLQQGTYAFQFDILVNAGDAIGCAIYIESNGNVITNPPTPIYDKFKVIHFETTYFKQTLGSSINFENYLALKDYKFLDFLRGVIDCFDLSIQTDDIRKIVFTEPTHAYSLNNDLSDVQPGYFNGNIISMDSKHDLSQKSDITLFNDTNRSQIFRFKQDDSDGGIKGVGDFRKVELGTAKFTLPDRFSDDDETSNENRFFSAMMHTEMPGLTNHNDGKIVYVPALLPENISDTSKDAAQNTLLPKLAYYNGTQDKVFFLKANNESQPNPDVQLPEMFAVNYMTGGENSPNLNYNDEMVNGTIVPGLLRRFYIKRMAVIRQGVWYDTFLKLTNLDILNNFHREYFSLMGQKLELVQINNYNPLSDKATSVLLRRDAPVTQDDLDNCAPSINSVTNNNKATLANNDLPYWPAAIAAPDDIKTSPNNL